MFKCLERQGWRIRRDRAHFVLYPANTDHSPLVVTCSSRPGGTLKVIKGAARRKGAVL